MLERQKRLNEVYEHLHNHFGVHTKGEFADIIKYARAYISSAMNGNERYLTDKLFTNICEAYPETFNIEYLLHGTGQLLTIHEEVANDERENVNQKNQIDQGSLVNAALAAKDEAYATLQKLLDAKEETIQTLRSQLADRDDHIATLKARVAELRRIIDSHDLTDALYKFPTGSAEQPSRKK